MFLVRKRGEREKVRTEGSTAEKRGRKETLNFYSLPEGCISSIIAFTTPSDASRFALVSKLFLSASESDSVWDKFLPSDSDLIIAESDAGEAEFAQCKKKKQLYFRLVNRPLLLQGGTKSFSLDKWNGIKCWMIGARSLIIHHGDKPESWKWTSNSESRFPEVAQLVDEERVHIRAKMETATLTQRTSYAAYLVYKMTDNAKGLDSVAKTSVFPPAGKSELRLVFISVIGSIRLSSIAERLDQGPRRRTDGWQEVKIGEFFTYVGEEGRVGLFFEMKYGGGRMSGLIVQGMEVRPVIATAK